MNIIEITIGEKKYKISCSPGEEDHIRGLASKLNKRFTDLEQSLGDKASDNVILVILGLMLEDELSGKAEDTNSTPQKNTNDQEKSDKIAELNYRITSIISRLEEIKA